MGSQSDLLLVESFALVLNEFIELHDEIGEVVLGHVLQPAHKYLVIIGSLIDELQQLQQHQAVASLEQEAPQREDQEVLHLVGCFEEALEVGLEVKLAEGRGLYRWQRT